MIRSGPDHQLQYSPLPSSAIDVVTIYCVRENLPSKAMQTTLPLQISTTKDLGYLSTYICKWTYRESGTIARPILQRLRRGPNTLPFQRRPFIIFCYIHCTHTHTHTHHLQPITFFNHMPMAVVQAAAYGKPFL